jgi:hypothetical protein
VHLPGVGDLFSLPYRKEFDFISHNLTFSFPATNGFELAGKAGPRPGEFQIPNSEFRIIRSEFAIRHSSLAIDQGVVSDGHPAVSASSNRPLSACPVAFALLSVAFLF